MNRTERYRTLIKELLTEFAAYSPSTENVCTELLFDDAHGHYQICFVGWENEERVHNVMMHLDLVDDKIWIQENATDIEVSRYLLREGVPMTHIVPGLVSPAMRQYSDFAVA